MRTDRREFVKTGIASVAGAALAGNSFSLSHSDLPVPKASELTKVPTLPFRIAVTEEKIGKLPDYMSDRNPQDMDFPYCPVEIEGEYWIIYRNGYQKEVIRFKGTNVETAVRQPDGVAPDSGYGKYMLGGMWYDPSDKKLYAFNHCESRGYYVSRNSGILRAIGVMSSTDKGLTWTDMGPIVTRDDPSKPRPRGHEYSGLCWDGGSGDFSVYVDSRSGYVYIFSMHDVWPKPGVSLPGTGQVLCRHHVARCAFADKMAPGKWRKFYNGAWNEPGLGGKASHDVNAYMVTYNEHLKLYLGFDWGGNLAVCRDLGKQDWSPSFSVPGARWGYCMTITASDKRNIFTCGREFFIYMYIRKEAGRIVRIEVGPGSTPAIGYYPAGTWPNIGKWEPVIVTMDPGRLYAYGSLYESDDPIESRRTRRVGCDVAAPEVVWSDGWASEKNDAYYEGVARTSAKAGASVQFTFKGTAVYWRPFKGPDCGKADIILDGEHQGTMDCYAFPATGFQFGFIKMGLKPGVEHTLKVVVRGEMSDAQGAKGTLIRHMLFEHEADSYRASDGFSSIQGKNQWSYLQKSSLTRMLVAPRGEGVHQWSYLQMPNVLYEKLTYMDPRWQGKDGCVIGYSSMSPVAGIEAVRTWVAPRDGTVRLEGTPSLMKAAESAYRIGILKGSDYILPMRSFSQQAQVLPYDLTVAVREGDVISFIAARREATREEKEAMEAMRLTVLSNSGPVMLIGGKPIRIGLQKYEQSRHCHAVSKLMVRVSGPAREFSAMVSASGPAQGSMVFIVTVDGKSVFRSGVLSAGMQAVPVHVSLDGNQEFQLEVSDAANSMSIDSSGMSMDQAAWADAKVILADGKELWLSDLPLRDVADQGIFWDPCITYVVGEG